MVGVDTNVVVRLLAGDDPAQAERAKAVFKKDAVFISDTVMLETEWVLRYTYDITPADIHRAFTNLCGLPNVVVPDPHLMLTALQWYADGLDFADALHLASARDCKEFLTFDRKLLRKAEGKGACKVRET